MADTAAQLRRELLLEIRDNDVELQKLMDQAIRDINIAAKQDHKAFERRVLAIIGAFWASYALLTQKSNAAVAQSFVTYIDNTVGKNLLKVGATQDYMNQIAQPPTAKRPKGKLQLQLESAHNRGDLKEEARLNKLVDASMRTDAGMSTKVREEFLKAMRAGKPITMTEAQKRAGEAATSKYADEIEKGVLGRKHPIDNRSIEQRIVTLKRGSEKVVKGLLDIGLNADMSVNQVARAIQSYIDPLSQAGTRVTAGNAINYKAVPIGKTLPKGSIRYNAVRIARSEIMQTYDNASNDYYNDQPWTDGWDWFLSNTHAGEDGCDTLANSNPHKDLPRRPHPQCTCDVRAHVASLKEFEQLVKSGAIQ
jgi:hypothetical protein